MTTELDILAKLMKIQALYEGATTPGERDAAHAAKERLSGGLPPPSPPLAKQERARPHRFRLADEWTVALLVALARKHELRVYRQYRQHRTTIMVDVVHSFLDRVLWPEFLALNRALRGYLDEATERILREAVHPDTSEAPLVGELQFQEDGQ